MRFLVVLDARSVIGGVYSAGSNDGYVEVDGIRHPVLNCLTIDPGGYYLYVERDMTKHQGPGTKQKLQVPHSYVAYIVQYADEGPRPPGFVFKT